MRVRESARRLKRLHGVLRQTTFLAARWAIDCPELEVKILLARHLWQDASMVACVEARLAELAHQGSDDDAPLELLTPAAIAKGSPERLAALYLVAKGRLLAEVRDHRRATGPILDEPTVVVLRDVERIIEAQIADLGATWTELRTAFPTTFAESAAALAETARANAGAKLVPISSSVPAVPGLDPRLTLGTVPARDVGLGSPRTLMHVMLTDTEIATIELTSRLILEATSAPWAFVLDMARQTWDEARHALSVKQRLEELGGRFGDYPISRYLWDAVAGQPVEVALAIQQRIGEWTGVEGALWHARKFAEMGDEATAILWEYIAEDEIAHVAFGNRWIARFVESEEQIQAVHDLALRVRQSHGKNLDPIRPFPFVQSACERAGFSPDTVNEYARHAEQHGTRFT